MTNRNPVIFPDAEPSKRVCPKCKSDDFNGRNIQGMILYTCANKNCKTEWGGGISVDQFPSNIPILPDADNQPIIFEKGPGDTIKEVKRLPSPTQEYRKGVPAKTEE